MTEKLEGLLRRHRELTIRISDPDLTRDPKQYKAVMQEYSQLDALHAQWKVLEDCRAQIMETQAMLFENDPALKTMARDELKDLEAKLAEGEKSLNLLLIPKDPLDDKNTIV